MLRPTCLLWPLIRLRRTRPAGIEELRQSLVVLARKIIDIRAQSNPVSFCLCAVISFGYDLVDATRAVHDLHLCLQIIGRRIKLAPKSVRGVIQIVHSVFRDRLLFCLVWFPRASVFPESERCRRVVAPLLCADCAWFLASPPRFSRYFLELVHAFFHFADAVRHLSLGKRICLVHAPWWKD